MSEDSPKKRESTTNWFFWIILGLIGIYYAYHFFIASNVREKQMNQISTNELVSMVESIKGREEFYQNLVSSWSNSAEVCEYFSGVFEGAFKCELKNPYNQNKFHSEFLVVKDTSIKEGVQQEGIDDIFYGDERLYFNNSKKAYLDEGAFFLPFVHFNKIESEADYAVFQANRLFLPMEELFQKLINENSLIEGYTIFTSPEASKAHVVADHPQYNSSTFSQVVFNDSKNLFSNDTTSYMVQKADVSIGGNNYKVLETRFRLDEYPMDFRIIGYVSEANWLSEVQEFDLHGSILFGGFVLIIILLIPHLRILTLSRSDRLGYVHAVRLFTSLILMIPILLVMFRFNEESRQLKELTKDELDTIHTERDNNISRKLVGLDTATEMLLKFENLIHDEAVSMFLEPFEIDEYTWLNKNGVIEEVGFFGSMNPEQATKNILKGNVNFAYRKYFKNRSQGQTVFEFVKSVSSKSGIEIIFATQQDFENLETKDVDETIDQTVIITSSLDTLKSRPGSFFHIINGNGEILYDSRNINSVNVLGNFFDRIEGDILNDPAQLKNFLQIEPFAVIYQNERRMVSVSPIQVPVNSFGRNTAPVENYYLVSFQDTKVIDVFHGATFGMVILLMFIYFLFLILLWRIISAVSKRKTHLEREGFSLPWLLPRNNNFYAYLFLILYMVGAVLFQLFLEPRINFVGIFALTLFNALITGVLAFFLLSSSNRFNSKSLRFFKGVKLRIDVILNKNETQDVLISKHKVRNAYGLFLVLWFMFFSLTPTWLFMEKVEELETYIMLKRVDTGRDEIDIENLGKPQDLYLNLRGRLLSFPSIQRTQFDAMGEFDKEEHYSEILLRKYGADLKQTALLGLILGLILFSYQRFVFRRMYFDLDFDLRLHKFDENDSPPQLFSNPKVQTFIVSELEPLDFNSSDHKEVQKIIKPFESQWSPQVAEYAVLKLQEYFAKAYQELWDQCNPDEKLLLYDLAEDGCMNAINKGPILDLIDKGLIVYDINSVQGPEVMNKSFQNFILSRCKNDQELDHKLASSKQGKWSNSKTIVLIAVLLMFFLSFAVHEKVLEQVFAIATGAIAVVPSLMGNLSSVQLPKFRIGQN